MAGPGATLAGGVLKIDDGAPPLHITGFKIIARIDVEALAPLEIADCKFRDASSSSRRLLEEDEEEVPALIVRNGRTMITNSDFKGLERAIQVQDGSLAIADSTFRGNRDTIYVIGGNAIIANTTFIASRGTAVHVIGGDVVLRDQTTLLGSHTSLNISGGARVRYELPAPLGRYVFIQDNSGIYHFERGEHNGDFPFACAAGVVGNSYNVKDQTAPRCTGSCPAGYYCGKQTVSPVPCQAGTYCPEESPSETACPAGTYSPNELATELKACLVCWPGTFCPERSKQPTACTPGTFNPERGRPLSCTPCAENTWSTEGSSSCDSCLRDYYAINDPGDVECRRCPFGSECKQPGSTLARLPLLPGFWRTNNGSANLRRCPDASSPDTSACVNMNDVLCKPWTDGPYCRVCNVTDSSRYFDSDQSACVECGDTATTSLAALIGTTLVTLLLLCWCGWRQPCKRLRNAACQSLPKIRAPLKQMVAFYQVRYVPELHACALTLKPVHRLPPLTCADCNARRERLQRHNASIRRFIAQRL